jgi:transcriptional regulator with PAS, ATPase and Fis domain
MIFLPRKLLTLLVLVSAAATVLFGLGAYLIFSPQTAYTPLELKLISEWFLFAALGVVTLQLILLLRIARVRTVVKRELQRIQSMSSYGSLSSQLNSKRLYELGPLLDGLFSQVSRINERQSIKMGSQSALITFLASNMKAPVIITDPFGKILFLSTESEEKFKKDRSEILNTNIENLVHNVLVQSVVEQIRTKQSYQKEQKDDEPFTVYPVYNREKEIAYLIFDFRSNSNFEYTQGTGTQAVAGIKKEVSPFSIRWNRLGGVLSRFVSRKNRQDQKP